MSARRMLLVLALTFATPGFIVAQVTTPGPNTVAIGGDVGFLASDSRASAETPYTLQTATGNADAFVEYYYSPRASLRAMYGWASPEIEAIPGRSLRRQHLNVNLVYNWEFGRFRPFATAGGGTYFLSRLQAGAAVGDSVAKPGANVGWGAEYYLRVFAVKSEMNVHILTDEEDFPELNGNTLAAFTWTFGIKVPF